MITLTYRYDFHYRYVKDQPFPLLLVQVSNLLQPEAAVDVDAYLDSGAERSIFDGFVIPSLGLDLMSGEPKDYTPTSGPPIRAYLHRVKLFHPELGNFELEIGFSEGRIRRNLLGRDFFNLVQVGFRESQLVYYVNPTP